MAPFVARRPLDCANGTGPGPGVSVGGSEQPAFATDQLHVSLVTIPPGETLRPMNVARRMWVIALDTANVGRELLATGAPRWVGGVFQSAAGTAWTVTNRGRSPVTVVTVVEP